MEPEVRSPAQVLRAMLEGTGLYYYQLTSGTYAIGELSKARSQRGHLAGFVSDAATGIPLPDAHVKIFSYDDLQRGTVSNDDGIFAFGQLPVGVYFIIVSFVGYEDAVQQIEVWPNVTTEHHIPLRATLFPLTPILVESSQVLDQPFGLSHTVTEQQWQSVTNLGASDAVRGLNHLPGVRVNDGMADVHIQGGEAGEHQFRLDGTPIFEPVHLRGLVGAFNPFAIGRITAHKAGFDATEGSQLAGIIDAEHALLDTDDHPLDLQADPLSLNGRLNLNLGTIAGIEGQAMAAYRSSLWNGWWDTVRPAHIDSLLLDWNTPDEFLLRSTLLPLREISRNIFDLFEQRLDSLPPPSMPNLAFTDAHAAGRLRFQDGSSFYVSYYLGKNRVENRRLTTAVDTLDTAQNPDRYDWINENAQARIISPVGANMLLTTRIRTSRYDLQHDYSALSSRDARLLPFTDEGVTVIIDLTPADDGNRIRESALESTLDIGHRRGYATMGLEVTHTDHRFVVDDVFFRSIKHTDAAWHLAAFAQEKYDLTSWGSITGGARFTYLQPHARIYAEPRLELRFQFPETPLGAVGLRTAGGVYRQYLNQFDVSSISPSALFPSIRFWLPVDSSITPPKAYHLAGDLVVQPREDWTFRLESYFKDQPLLYRVDYSALWSQDSFVGTDGTEPIKQQSGFLEMSHGEAYGAALVLEYTRRTLRASTRYEYNIARREYAFQDTVRMEAVPWSEPHRLELALNWTPHPRFIATARWRGGWGRIWGFRQAYYDFFGTNSAFESVYGEYDFQDPAAHTLPAFQQLDLGAAYTQPIGPTALQLRLDVQNATNRTNIADRSLIDIEQDDRIEIEARNRNLLSRTVSFSVRLRW